jgi:hypothetical protein
MRAFLGKHLYAILGALLLNAPYLWRGFISITDWLSRFDFWVTHGRDIAGISELVGFVTDPPPWTVFITSGAGIAIVYWDVRRQARASEPVPTINSAQKLRLVFFSGCAAVAIGVWIMAWPHYFSAKASIIPAGKSPPALTPWVTNEDIEAQRKLGRMLLVYSPQEFAALYARGQSLKVYEKNWLKVDYPIARLPIIETIDKKDYYVVYATLATIVQPTTFAAAYFDPEKWGDQLLKVRIGGQLRAICQYMGFDQKITATSYAEVLLGYNCELS